MRLTFTPRCTTGATDSAIERPCERSPVSKSDTVVPSATVPARVRAPLRTSKVSRSVVLPPELGPTSTTLRISSGLRASRSCLPAARAPLSAMGTRCSCSGATPQPLGWTNSQSMALRRRRTYSSSVTEEQTVEGGLAEPEELEPEQGSLDLAAPEDRHDRGASGRQRPPPCSARRAGSPTTTPTRRSGTSSRGRPSTASASPRSVRRICSTGSSPRAGRPDRGRGTSGRTSWSPMPRRTTRRCSPTSRAGSPRCGSRPTRTPTGRSCSTRCCSTSRPSSCRRPRPAPAPSCSTPTAASCTRAPTSAWTPGSPPGSWPSRPGRRGVRVFVVDATEVHDRGASDVQELAHSLAVGAALPAHG